MYVVIISLYISNNMDSPVDVGGFAEPRKILCLGVLYLPWAIISTSPVGFPNNWYQSTWFKGVFDFCSKMKVVKIVFWSYHFIEREREKCREQERKWRATIAAALLPLQQLQVQQESWELSLSEVILLLHVCCNPFSIHL